MRWKTKCLQRRFYQTCRRRSNGWRPWCRWWCQWSRPRETGSWGCGWRLSGLRIRTGVNGSHWWGHATSTGVTDQTRDPVCSTNIVSVLKNKLQPISANESACICHHLYIFTLLQKYVFVTKLTKCATYISLYVKVPQIIIGWYGTTKILLSKEAYMR